MDDPDFYNQLIKRGLEPEFKSNTVGRHHVVAAGVEERNGDKVGFMIGVDADKTIQAAAWDGHTSVLGEGMTDWICETVIGLTLKGATDRKWPEVKPWARRPCTFQTFHALQRAINAAYEELSAKEGTGSKDSG